MSENPETANGPVTERMPAQAAAFVEACKAAGVALDYLPRTLPIAEKFVKGAPAEVERMAAYLGEVIRRETKGFWFDAEGTPMVYAGIEPYVDPAAVVHALLEGGSADAGGTRLESAKAYCEWICRQQKQWLDRSVLGTYDSISALRTSMAADAKTAGTVLALAQNAVLTAQLDWSESLDSTEDSLDAVERILGQMHVLTKKQGVSEEHIDAVSKSMGIYLGEVIRRHYGGQWRLSDTGSFELPYPNTTLEPVARARKRITDGPSESVRMYFNSMPRVISS